MRRALRGVYLSEEVAVAGLAFPTKNLVIGAVARPGGEHESSKNSLIQLSFIVSLKPNSTRLNSHSTRP